MTASIKFNADTYTEMVTMTNIIHKDKNDMNGLTFYLGSSDTTQFSSINGYFYAPKLYTTQGEFVADTSNVMFFMAMTTMEEVYMDSEDEIEAHFDTIPDAIEQKAEHFERQMISGTTEYDTVCNHPENHEMIWSTDKYPFAQEYAVHAWIKSTATCDEEQTVFRLVIDVPEEYNSDNTMNPNFNADGEW